MGSLPPRDGQASRPVPASAAPCTPRLTARSPGAATWSPVSPPTSREGWGEPWGSSGTGRKCQQLLLSSPGCWPTAPLAAEALQGEGGRGSRGAVTEALGPRPTQWGKPNTRRGVRDPTWGPSRRQGTGLLTPSGPQLRPREPPAEAAPLPQWPRVPLLSQPARPPPCSPHTSLPVPVPGAPLSAACLPVSPQHGAPNTVRSSPFQRNQWETCARTQTPHTTVTRDEWRGPSREAEMLTGCCQQESLHRAAQEGHGGPL